MYPGIDAAKYIKLHTSGPIRDLVSKIIKPPSIHYDLDKSYDCQHLLILYEDLHQEVATANEAAKLILDKLSGYDKYCFGEIYAEYAHSIGTTIKSCGL